MKELVIIGAVGTCLDIAEAAAASGAFTVRGFLDDGLPSGHMTPYGLPVLGGTADVSRFPDALFVNGIGSPASYRAKPGFVDRLGLPLERFATVIHPTSVVSATARLEPGCAILAQCSIGSGVCVGAHTVMLQQCVIGHDSRIGAHSIFAAGVVVSGSVDIGCNCYLGAGAAIRNGMRIGAGALVGVGSAVVSNIPAAEVWYGNPARCGRGAA